MQLTEIRWQTETSEAERSSGRVPIGRGITLIDPGALSDSALVLQNLHLDLVLKAGEKSPLYTPSSILFWQFILHENQRTYRFSTDRDAPFKENLFRRIIIGDEGIALGDKLDPDASFDLKDALTRLESSRDQLCEMRGKRGRLVTLLEDYEALLEDIKAHGGSQESTHVLQMKAEESKRQLAALEREDKRLLAEQQTLKYLAIKSEYEDYLRLKEELQKTEEQEGQYGSRITPLGHDITVHDLAELAGMRNELRDIQRQSEEAGTILKAARRERMKAEQQRILLRRGVSDMEQERPRLYERLMHEKMATHPVETVRQEAPPFPTLNHFFILLAVLLFALGLYATLYTVVGGIAMAALSLVLGGYFAVRSYLSRVRSQKRSDPRHSHESKLETALRQLDSRMAGAKLELEEVEQGLLSLEREETKWAVEEETLGRNYRRTESELLRVLRRYAGPSDIEETDAIITALSRQRDKSAQYNETVADLLRRIADIKHGRSNEELEREYDRACKTLFEEMKLSPELVYDPKRAQEVFDERLTLAEQIDGLEKSIRGQEEQMSETRSSQVTMGSLAQREKALAQSLEEAFLELYRLDAAWAWAREIDSSGELTDAEAWMRQTGDFVNRLLGRRVSGAVILPVEEARPKMRAPRFAGQDKSEDKRAVDVPAILGASPDLRYLAARLALVKSQRAFLSLPLILIGPIIRSGRVARDDLFNTLVEWTLETGNQVLWFTEDPALVSIAKARNIDRYSLVQEREDK